MGKAFRVSLAWLGLAGAALAGGACRERDPIPAEPRFAEDVRPVLARYCLECHGLEAEEAGLDLRTVGAILEGGESGPAIVRGAPEDSLLLDQMTDEIMPPEGPLPGRREIELVRRWVATGARP